MKKIITWACIFVLAVSLVGCQFLEQESSQQESRAPEESFAVEESAAANSSQEESSVLEDSSVPEESESSTVEESSEVEDSQVEEESNAVEESAAEESSVSEESSMMQAYMGIIESLTEQYGEGVIGSSSLDGQSVMTGLGIVRLLDMNGDDVQELYCAFSRENAAFLDYQQIYQYQDGEAILAFEGPISNNGTDVSPMTELIYKGEDVYLADGRPLSLDGQYLRVTEGSTEVMFCFESGYISEDEKFYINDEEVTEEEYQEAISIFLEDATVVDIWYYGDYNADTGFGVDPMNLQRTQDVIAEIQAGI